MRLLRVKIALLVSGASAFALAQTAAPSTAPDAPAPDSAPQTAPQEGDAAPAEQAPIETDAGPPETPDAAPPDAAPVPLAAPPPELSPVGFDLALRAAYGVPYGDAKGSSFPDVVPGAVHIGIEVGYFFTPNFYVGGYFTFGFATGDSSAGTACSDVDSSCSATPIRLGASARWHFLPRELLDPWAGLGVGYEIVNVSESTSTSNEAQSASLHGFEAMFQAGVDYKPRPFYGIGPFIESSFGHFTSSPSATSLHGWFDIGLHLRTRL
jgi:opacity protein-like surface antigen